LKKIEGYQTRDWRRTKFFDLLKVHQDLKQENVESH